MLVLSQGGAVLYEAKNDSIITEITNEGFPFPETSYTTENNEQASDSEKKDNLVREYFNNVDKALVKICKKSDLKCVVCLLYTSDAADERSSVDLGGRRIIKKKTKNTKKKKNKKKIKKKKT